MRIEIRMKKGTRLQRDVPYENMEALMSEYLLQNNNDWFLFGDTAVPKYNIAWISPTRTQPPQTVPKKRRIGFKTEDDAEC